MPKYFPLVTTRTVTIEVPVGDGNRDVSYLDSADIADELAGTLGPVQTQDSIDASDEFVADELTLQESIDVSEQFGEIQGLVLLDTSDVSDELAGTLGPVQTQDTVDTDDVPNFGPATLIESYDSDDIVNEISLDTTQQESIDLSDELQRVLIFTSVDTSPFDSLDIDELVVQEELDSSDFINDISTSLGDDILLSDAIGQIIQVGEDFFDSDDNFNISSLVIDNSPDTLDFINDISTSLGDTTDISNESFVTLSSDIPDSSVCSDLLFLQTLDVPDSIEFLTIRQDASGSNARLWPNSVVSNTGFTNPNNLIDLSEATATTISATQSDGLLGGNSVTVNGNIQVDCPSIDIVPPPSIINAQIQYGYTTTASGGLQNGNSVNVTIEYSLNNGGAWTNLSTVTTAATTQNPTANITLNYAQLNQLRFRAVGSVASGTTPLVGGANQTFQMRYFRIQFNFTQVL